MFFVGCAFVAYSTYELLSKSDRRRLGDTAFGIFAMVPALRVFEAITPYGYSIYYRDAAVFGFCHCDIPMHQSGYPGAFR